MRPAFPSAPASISPQRHSASQRDLGPHLSEDEESQGVQLLLGHSKLESTVRYLGVEVDDALEMAEQTEV
jgi:hypothetical protein